MPGTQVHTNDGERKRAFVKFRKEVGLKAFGPEFIDSLVAVMSDANSCLTEQTYSWQRWRSWCNSSLTAVSDWDRSSEGYYMLDQTDCALDLAWFQEGKSLEWVEGAPRSYRERARDRNNPECPRKMLPKSRISEAFTAGENRGTVIFEGRKILTPVSPTPKAAPKVTRITNFETDKIFLKWWQSSRPANFAAWESSYRAHNEAKKVGRAAYREFMVREQSPTASSITSNGLSNGLNNEDAPPPKNSPEVVEKQASAEPAAAASLPQQTQLETLPVADRWRDVRQWFTANDPSAEPEQVESLIDDCVAATTDRVPGGIPPPDLYQILLLWPINGVRSVFALLSKKLPALLGDPQRLKAWIEKYTSANPNKDSSNEREARRTELFRELIAQRARGHAT